MKAKQDIDFELGIEIFKYNEDWILDTCSAEDSQNSVQDGNTIFKFGFTNKKH